MAKLRLDLNQALASGDQLTTSLLGLSPITKRQGHTEQRGAIKCLDLKVPTSPQIAAHDNCKKLSCTSATKPSQQKLGEIGRSKVHANS